MPVEPEHLDASKGWTLQQAIERTADPELWDAWIVANAAFQKINAPIPSSAGSFLRHPPEKIRAARQEAVAAFDRVGLHFRKLLSDGMLFATGSRGERSVAPTPIYRDGWITLRIVTFEKSVIQERSGPKPKIYNVKVFPIIHADDATDQLSGCSLVDAFRKCVLFDPEAVAASKRISSNKQYESVFKEGRFPGPFIHYTWPCDCTPSNLAFQFVKPIMIDLGRDLPEAPAPIVHVSEIIIDRWRRLRRRLIEGELIARGTHIQTGTVQYIDALQWARQGISVDVKSGDFLEEQNYKPVVQWSGLSLVYAGRPDFDSSQLRPPHLATGTWPRHQMTASHVKPVAHDGAPPATAEQQLSPVEATGNWRHTDDAGAHNAGRRRKTAQQASVEAAVAALWPEGIPMALTNKARDQQIIDWQRREGLTVCSSKTIGRHLPNK